MGCSCIGALGMSVATPNSSASEDCQTSRSSIQIPKHAHCSGRELLWMESWGNGELRNGDLSGLEIKSFIASLRACTRNKDLIRGTSIHDDLVRRGLLDKCSGVLAIMYAKCGDLVKAKSLLEGQKITDPIAWTALLAGYVRERHGQNALDCLEQMHREGILPDAVTFAIALRACALIRDVSHGKQIHKVIERQGLLQNDIVLGNALVDMYSKCGDVLEARRVLEELPFRNVVSWNTLISGYVYQGEAEQALDLVEQMQHEGILPDAVTYACGLKACAMIRASGRGKQMHKEIARQGLLHNNTILGNALVDMYAKCGNVSEAQQVFDGLFSRNVVAWSALITGYTQEGQAEQALICFQQMQHDGILPDAVTYACALKASASIRAASMGKQIHKEIARQGLLQNDIVLGNALVDFYAKCGDVLVARRVLEELPFRNVVSWASLIAGYAQEGEADQALYCLEQMKHEGILPDAMIYACALKACAIIRDSGRGKQIHEEIARQGLLRNDLVLANTLLDMYVKCDDVLEARRVLDELPSRNVVSWSVLIAGYAQKGEAVQALNCLELMYHECIRPDAVTFACVLSVCSHLGLLEQGQKLFLDMSTKYGVKPNLECYTCMIGLLGRTGHLEKAVKLIQEMPSFNNTAIWYALLDACRIRVDINVGEWAFDELLKLDKSDGSAYVLMANIYAAAGMEEKAKSVEARRFREQAMEEVRP